MNKTLKVYLLNIWKVLYAIFAVIGMFTVFNWYWSNFVYGIHKNDMTEDVLIINQDTKDTVFHELQIPPGTLTINRTQKEVTLLSKDGIMAHMVRLPENSFVEIKKYNQDGERVVTEVWQ
jgi:hypothetical protein